MILRELLAAVKKLDQIFGSCERALAIDFVDRKAKEREGERRHNNDDVLFPVLCSTTKSMTWLHILPSFLRLWQLADESPWRPNRFLAGGFFCCRRQTHLHRQIKKKCTKLYLKRGKIKIILWDTNTSDGLMVLRLIYCTLHVCMRVRDPCKNDRLFFFTV